MAISKTKKQTIVKGTGEIVKYPVVFFVDFSQAKTSMVNEFKKTIKAFDAVYVVIKKNLLGISLKNARRSADWLDSHPRAIGMVYTQSADRQIELAKAIQKFIRDNNSKVKTKDSLAVVAAYLDAELWAKEQIIRLAQIPAKEILQGQLVNIISYPIAGLAQTLAGVMQNFLLTLKEVERIGANHQSPMANNN